MLRNFEPFNTNSHPTVTDETYSIILNSNLSTGTPTDALFNFDWSVLPDRNYLVHYSFNSSNMSITSGKVCIISSDIFSHTNTYVAGAQTGRTSAQSSNILGVAYPYIYGATSALHADDSTAPPTYLNTRPTLNQFSVHIKTADATPVSYPNLAEWVLVLHFTPVDRTGRALI
jgi:hypothetical protein